MKKRNIPADMFCELPPEMKNYLRHYGYHFSPAMYRFAVSKMRKKIGEKMEKIEPATLEKCEELLKQHNVTLEDGVNYDVAYLYSMIDADFFGKSIPNEQYKALHIKAMMEDPDQEDGYIFNRWVGDMWFSGEPIYWEEML